MISILSSLYETHYKPGDMFTAIEDGKRVTKVRIKTPTGHKYAQIHPVKFREAAPGTPTVKTIDDYVGSPKPMIKVTSSSSARKHFNDVISNFRERMKQSSVDIPADRKAKMKLEDKIEAINVKKDLERKLQRQRSMRSAQSDKEEAWRQDRTSPTTRGFKPRMFGE